MLCSNYLWVEIIDMTFTELIQFLNLGIYNDITLYEHC